MIHNYMKPGLGIAIGTGIAVIVLKVIVVASDSIIPLKKYSHSGAEIRCESWQARIKF